MAFTSRAISNIMTQFDDAAVSILHMHMLGRPVSEDILLSCLQECTAKKSIVTCRAIHTFLVSSELKTAAIFGDQLIRLFAFFGRLMEARFVFYSIAEPSVYTWQAIISAHVNHGEYVKAMEFHTKMKDGDVSSNEFIFICAMKSFGRLRLIEQGRHEHSSVVKYGLESDVFVGSSLIDMYAKCECIQEAQITFDKLSNKNVVSWHAMLMGYAQHGLGDVALKLFNEMQKESLCPTKVTYLCMLKACGNAVSSNQGRLIHMEVLSHGFESDLAIGNTLIDMYVKWGNLHDAWHVFESLPVRDLVSWGALLAGCSIHDPNWAFHIFRRMHYEGMNANKGMFVCILKVCSNVLSWFETTFVHYLILRNGILMETDVGNALLDAYAKCGCLDEALKVFAALQSPDVVSYGALISGYTMHGNGVLALELFDSMKQSSIKPNKFIFPCVLKCCGAIGIIYHGMLIHNNVMEYGISSDLVVMNAVVDMYAKCGRMVDAQKVFHSFPLKNVVSWSTMITGYTQNEQFHSAVDCFNEMQIEGIEPNKATFLSVLQACRNARFLAYGELAYERIIENGLESDVEILNTIIDMFCKCGDLDAAHNVFNKTSNPDGITWSVMISGYAQAGHHPAAIEHFERMIREGEMPHEFMLPCILKACGSVEVLENVKYLHDHIVRINLIPDVIVASALLDAYAKCGSLQDARKVFDDMLHQNEVSCGMMIAGYIRNGHSCLALDLFQNVQGKNFEPGIPTLVTVLKACGDIGALGQGHSIHEAIVQGALDADIIIGSSLVDMYAQCGCLKEARKVFDGLSEPDIVLWGSMIAAYVEQGSILPSLELLQRMQEVGLKPNNVVYLSLLKACCTVNTIEHGKSIHAQIIQMGFECDPCVGNTLVDMYAKCGKLDEASQVFQTLPNRDAIAWTALMSGYSEVGHGDCALELFDRMLHDGVDPGKATFLCTLKACTSLGSLKQGRLMHHQIIEGALEMDTTIMNTLINMYARTGLLEESQKLFNDLSNPEQVSWSTIMAGFAQQGTSTQAECFLKLMQQEDVQAHSKILSNFLSACSHAGQVDKGHHQYAVIQEANKIEPCREHFNCLIDLLARAGRLKQAETFLCTMPMGPDLTGWISILSACKTYGNVAIGRRCFDQVIQIDPDAAAGYMLMSSIYANAQMWEEYQEIQDLRKSQCAWKKPGKAWVEHDGRIMNFIVTQRDQIDDVGVSLYLDRLSYMLREEGYIPCVDVAGNEEVSREDVEMLFGKDGMAVHIHDSSIEFKTSHDIKRVSI